MKIKTLKDVLEVSHKIVEKLVKGNFCYFNITICENGTFSTAYFTPRAQIRGENKSFLGVGDYQKLMMLLLSHDNCSELDYNEKENSISLIFDNPFAKELEDLQEDLF